MLVVFYLLGGVIMSTLFCEVVAKDHVIYSGCLYSINVQGIEGDICILENHEPFVTPLKDGIIWGRFKSANGKISCVASMGGYVQAQKNRVIVLCSKAKKIQDVCLEQVKGEIAEIEIQLENLQENEIVSYFTLTRKLRWLIVQSEAKEKLLKGSLPFGIECLI